MNLLRDDKKNKTNINNHGIAFSEAAQIFEDPLHISILDKRFDYYEERWVSIGISRNGTAIVVGHLYQVTETGEEITKIITAKKATKREREQYEEIG